MIAKEVLVLCGLARAAAANQLGSAMRDARIWESKQAAYKRAAERHPPERWEQFAGECGRIDRSAKGRGDGDPWLQLERLLVAIADPRGRRLLAS
jgi:DNA polymerase-3 subunit delta